MLRHLTLTGFVLLFSAFLFASCSKSVDASDNGDAKKTKSVTKKVTLDVQGMTCAGCEYNVESALKKIDGVTKVEADAGKAVAMVEYDPKVAQIDQMVAAVNKTGYKASATAKDNDKEKKQKKDKE